MTAPSAAGRRSAAARLAGISLLAAGVAFALYVAGRLLTPNYTFGLFGRVGLDALILKSTLASICLIAYGVQLTSVRVAVHSLAGCFFYGAFVAKVLFVQSRRLPGWTLPVAGGALAVVVGVLWYTSALWYYNGYRLPGM